MLGSVIGQRGGPMMFGKEHAGSVDKYKDMREKKR